MEPSGTSLVPGHRHGMLRAASNLSETSCCSGRLPLVGATSRRKRPRASVVQRVRSSQRWSSAKVATRDPAVSTDPLATLRHLLFCFDGHLAASRAAPATRGKRARRPGRSTDQARRVRRWPGARDIDPWESLRSSAVTGSPARLTARPQGASRRSASATRLWSGIKPSGTPRAGAVCLGRHRRSLHRESPGAWTVIRYSACQFRQQ